MMRVVQTVLVVAILGWPGSAWADVVLFSTSAPQAADLGDGAHYHGVQSVLSTNWYPYEGGETTAVGDWFRLDAPARMTGVVFWGFLKQFGGGPGELHVYVFEFDGQQNAMIERFHAWNANVPNWDAYHDATEDPSSLGDDSVERWRVEFGTLPDQTGSTYLYPGQDYLLLVAGDDWADEFHWAHHAPDGIVGGRYDDLYWSPTEDIAETGLDLQPFDFGAGPVANNLAFQVIGLQPAVPSDFDIDNDVDEDDFEIFRACAGGPAVPITDPQCSVVDLDEDGDGDQSDFGLFQRCYCGSAIPPTPGCSTLPST